MTLARQERDEMLTAIATICEDEGQQIVSAYVMIGASGNEYYYEYIGDVVAVYADRGEPIVVTDSGMEYRAEALSDFDLSDIYEQVTASSRKQPQAINKH